MDTLEDAHYRMSKWCGSEMQPKQNAGAIAVVPKLESFSKLCRQSLSLNLKLCFLSQNNDVE
ncbi:hypothetical protein GS601_16705 [Myxacorys almedinensis A]|uniref:Uncharacterized protein n=1 Tax=Myxacorys almedinensis A TaxID=2690445 RepID=A0A8J8CKS5_9CYAN|nr:hypothetical protein [Myxacorys almedinensis A]